MESRWLEAMGAILFNTMTAVKSILFSRHVKIGATKMNVLNISMLTFILIGAITPGPVNLIATHTTVYCGIKRGLSHVAGASVAYAIVVLISGLLLRQFGHLSALALLTLRISGSLFLLYMAYKLLSLTHQSAEAVKDGASGFINGALIQLLNPKAWLFAGAGLSAFVLGGTNTLSDLLLFTFVCLVLCFIGVGAWALLGQVFARWLADPVKQKWFNFSLATALSLSVISIWLPDL
uniref:LysE family translocator n=1 Tax=Thaumasiovibrio occultus TaxID=1891184 RepID=UPI000B356648|nr:LysE family translocator [Thaumasiovibrio occultus]